MDRVPVRKLRITLLVAAAAILYAACADAGDSTDGFPAGAQTEVFVGCADCPTADTKAGDTEFAPDNAPFALQLRIQEVTVASGLSRVCWPNPGIGGCEIPAFDDFPRFVTLAPGDDLKVILLEPADRPGPILVLQNPDGSDIIPGGRQFDPEEPVEWSPAPPPGRYLLRIEAATIRELATVWFFPVEYR
jgi:hypothetical protein